MAGFVEVTVVPVDEMAVCTKCGSRKTINADTLGLPGILTHRPLCRRCAREFTARTPRRPCARPQQKHQNFATS